MVYSSTISTLTRSNAGCVAGSRVTTAEIEGVSIAIVADGEMAVRDCAARAEWERTMLEAAKAGPAISDEADVAASPRIEWRSHGVMAPRGMGVTPESAFAQAATRSPLMTV